MQSRTYNEKEIRATHERAKNLIEKYPNALEPKEKNYINNTAADNLEIHHLVSLVDQLEKFEEKLLEFDKGAKNLKAVYNDSSLIISDTRDLNRLSADTLDRLTRVLKVQEKYNQVLVKVLDYKNLLKAIKDSDVYKKSILKEEVKKLKTLVAEMENFVGDYSRIHELDKIVDFEIQLDKKLQDLGYFFKRFFDTQQSQLNKVKKLVGKQTGISKNYDPPHVKLQRKMDNVKGNDLKTIRGITELLGVAFEIEECLTDTYKVFSAENEAISSQLGDIAAVINSSYEKDFLPVFNVTATDLKSKTKIEEDKPTPKETVIGIFSNSQTMQTIVDNWQQEVRTSLNKEENKPYLAIYELAKKKDFRGICSVLEESGISLNLYSDINPIVLLTAEGEEEAVKFLIEVFNVPARHAVFAAARTDNLKFAGDLVSTYCHGKKPSEYDAGLRLGKVKSFDDDNYIFSLIAEEPKDPKRNWKTPTKAIEYLIRAGNIEDLNWLYHKDCSSVGRNHPQRIDFLNACVRFFGKYNDKENVEELIRLGADPQFALAGVIEGGGFNQELYKDIIKNNKNKFKEGREFYWMICKSALLGNHTDLFLKTLPKVASELTDGEFLMLAQHAATWGNEKILFVLKDQYKFDLNVIISIAAFHNHINLVNRIIATSKNQHEAIDNALLGFEDSTFRNMSHAEQIQIAAMLDNMDLRPRLEHRFSLTSAEKPNEIENRNQAMRQEDLSRLGSKISLTDENKALLEARHSTSTSSEYSKEITKLTLDNNAGYYNRMKYFSLSNRIQKSIVEAENEAQRKFELILKANEDPIPFSFKDGILSIASKENKDPYSVKLKNAARLLDMEITDQSYDEFAAKLPYVLLMRRLEQFNQKVKDYQKENNEFAENIAAFNNQLKKELSLKPDEQGVYLFTDIEKLLKSSKKCQEKLWILTAKLGELNNEVEKYHKFVGNAVLDENDLQKPKDFAEEATQQLKQHFPKLYKIYELAKKAAHNENKEVVNECIGEIQDLVTAGASLNTHTYWHPLALLAYENDKSAVLFLLDHFNVDVSDAVKGAAMRKDKDIAFIRKLTGEYGGTERWFAWGMGYQNESNLVNTFKVSASVGKSVEKDIKQHNEKMARSLIAGSIRGGNANVFNEVNKNLPNHKKYLETVLIAAAKINNEKLVNKLINDFNVDPTFAIEGAAKGGHTKLLMELLKNEKTIVTQAKKLAGTSKINEALTDFHTKCMYHAATLGHKETVLAIADAYNLPLTDAIEGAIGGGYFDLADEFEKKKKSKPLKLELRIYYAALGNQIDYVNTLLDGNYDPVLRTYAIDGLKAGGFLANYESIFAVMWRVMDESLREKISQTIISKDFRPIAIAGAKKKNRELGESETSEKVEVLKAKWKEMSSFPKLEEDLTTDLTQLENNLKNGYYYREKWQAFFKKSKQFENLHKKLTEFNEVVDRFEKIRHTAWPRLMEEFDEDMKEIVKTNHLTKDKTTKKYLVSSKRYHALLNNPGWCEDEINKLEKSKKLLQGKIDKYYSKLNKNDVVDKNILLSPSSLKEQLEAQNPELYKIYYLAKTGKNELEKIAAIQAIIDQGACITINKPWNPLTILASEGEFDAVRLLLDKFNGNADHAIAGIAMIENFNLKEEENRAFYKKLVNDYRASGKKAKWGLAYKNHPDSMEYFSPLFGENEKSDSFMLGALQGGQADLFNEVYKKNPTPAYITLALKELLKNGTKMSFDKAQNFVYDYDIPFREVAYATVYANRSYIFEYYYGILKNRGFSRDEFDKFIQECLKIAAGEGNEKFVEELLKIHLSDAPSATFIDPGRSFIVESAVAAAIEAGEFKLADNLIKKYARGFQGIGAPHQVGHYSYDLNDSFRVKSASKGRHFDLVNEILAKTPTLWDDAFKSFEDSLDWTDKRYIQVILPRITNKRLREAIAHYAAEYDSKGSQIRLNQNKERFLKDAKSTNIALKEIEHPQGQELTIVSKEKELANLQKGKPSKFAKDVSSMEAKIADGYYDRAQYNSLLNAINLEIQDIKKNQNQRQDQEIEKKCDVFLKLTHFYDQTELAQISQLIADKNKSPKEKLEELVKGFLNKLGQSNPSPTDMDFMNDTLEQFTLTIKQKQLIEFKLPQFNQLIVDFNNMMQNRKGLFADLVEEFNKKVAALAKDLDLELDKTSGEYKFKANKISAADLKFYEKANKQLGDGVAELTKINEKYLEASQKTVFTKADLGATTDELMANAYQKLKKDKLLNSIYLWAASANRKDHVDDIQNLMNKGAVSLYSINPNCDWNPITLLAYEGNKNAVEFLITHFNADPIYAIKGALIKGNVKFAEELIDRYGSDLSKIVRCAAWGNQTDFLVENIKNSSKVLTGLIISGAVMGRNVDLFNKFYAETKEKKSALNGALIAAARSNNVKLVDKLINEFQVDATYALEGAALGGHWDLLKKLCDENNKKSLLSFKFTLFEQNKNHILFLAAQEGHTEVVRQLIKTYHLEPAEAILGAIKGGHFILAEELAYEKKKTANEIVRAAAENWHIDKVNDMLAKQPHIRLEAVDGFLQSAGIENRQRQILLLSRIADKPVRINIANKLTPDIQTQNQLLKDAEQRNIVANQDEVKNKRAGVEAYLKILEDHKESSPAAERLLKEWNGYNEQIDEGYFYRPFFNELLQRVEAIAQNLSADASRNEKLIKDKMAFLELDIFSSLWTDFKYSNVDSNPAVPLSEAAQLKERIIAIEHKVPSETGKQSGLDYLMTAPLDDFQKAVAYKNLMFTLDQLNKLVNDFNELSKDELIPKKKTEFDDKLKEIKQLNIKVSGGNYQFKDKEKLKTNLPFCMIRTAGLKKLVTDLTAIKDSYAAIQLPEMVKQEHLVPFYDDVEKILNEDKKLADIYNIVQDAITNPQNIKSAIEKIQKAISLENFSLTANGQANLLFILGREKNRKAILFLLERFNANPDDAVKGAAMAGDKALVEDLIKNHGANINMAAWGAAYGNQAELLKDYQKNSAVGRGYLTEGGLAGGNIGLFMEYYNENPNRFDLSQIMMALTKTEKNIPLIEQFRQQYDLDVDDVIIGAAKTGNVQVFKHFYNKTTISAEDIPLMQTCMALAGKHKNSAIINLINDYIEQSQNTKHLKEEIIVKLYKGLNEGGQVSFYNEQCGKQGFNLAAGPRLEQLASGGHVDFINAEWRSGDVSSTWNYVLEGFKKGPQEDVLRTRERAGHFLARIMNKALREQLAMEVSRYISGFANSKIQEELLGFAKRKNLLLSSMEIVPNSDNDILWLNLQLSKEKQTQFSKEFQRISSKRADGYYDRWEYNNLVNRINKAIKEEKEKGDQNKAERKKLLEERIKQLTNVFPDIFTEKKVEVTESVKEDLVENAEIVSNVEENLEDNTIPKVEETLEDVEARLKEMDGKVVTAVTKEFDEYEQLIANHFNAQEKKYKKPKFSLKTNFTEADNKEFGENLTKVAKEHEQYKKNHQDQIDLDGKIETAFKELEGADKACKDQIKLIETSIKTALSSHADDETLLKIQKEFEEKVKKVNQYKNQKYKVKSRDEINKLIAKYQSDKEKYEAATTEIAAFEQRIQTAAQVAATRRQNQNELDQIKEQVASLIAIEEKLYEQVEKNIPTKKDANLKEIGKNLKDLKNAKEKKFAKQSQQNMEALRAKAKQDIQVLASKLNEVVTKENDAATLSLNKLKVIQAWYVKNDIQREIDLDEYSAPLIESAEKLANYYKASQEDEVGLLISGCQEEFAKLLKNFRSAKTNLDDYLQSQLDEMKNACPKIKFADDFTLKLTNKDLGLADFTKTLDEYTEINDNIKSCEIIFAKLAEPMKLLNQEICQFNAICEFLPKDDETTKILDTYNEIIKDVNTSFTPQENQPYVVPNLLFNVATVADSKALVSKYEKMETNLTKNVPELQNLNKKGEKYHEQAVKKQIEIFNSLCEKVNYFLDANVKLSKDVVEKFNTLSPANPITIDETLPALQETELTAVDKKNKLPYITALLSASQAFLQAQTHAKLSKLIAERDSYVNAKRIAENEYLINAQELISEADSKTSVEKLQQQVMNCKTSAEVAAIFTQLQKETYEAKSALEKTTALLAPIEKAREAYQSQLTSFAKGIREISDDYAQLFEESDKFRVRASQMINNQEEIAEITGNYDKLLSQSKDLQLAWEKAIQKNEKISFAVETKEEINNLAEQFTAGKNSAANLLINYQIQCAELRVQKELLNVIIHQKYLATLLSSVDKDDKNAFFSADEKKGFNELKEKIDGNLAESSGKLTEKNKIESENVTENEKTLRFNQGLEKILKDQTIPLYRNLIKRVSEALARKRQIKEKEKERIAKIDSFKADTISKNSMIQQHERDIADALTAVPDKKKAAFEEKLTKEKGELAKKISTEFMASYNEGEDSDKELLEAQLANKQAVELESLMRTKVAAAKELKTEEENKQEIIKNLAIDTDTKNKSVAESAAAIDKSLSTLPSDQQETFKKNFTEKKAEVDAEIAKVKADDEEDELSKAKAENKKAAMLATFMTDKQKEAKELEDAELEKQKEIARLKKDTAEKNAQIIEQEKNIDGFLVNLSSSDKELFLNKIATEKLTIENKAKLSKPQDDDELMVATLENEIASAVLELVTTKAKAAASLQATLEEINELIIKYNKDYLVISEIFKEIPAEKEEFMKKLHDETDKITREYSAITYLADEFVEKANHKKQMYKNIAELMEVKKAAANKLSEENKNLRRQIGDWRTRISEYHQKIEPIDKTIDLEANLDLFTNGELRREEARLRTEHDTLADLKEIEVEIDSVLNDIADLKHTEFVQDVQEKKIIPVPIRKGKIPISLKKSEITSSPIPEANLPIELKKSKDELRKAFRDNYQPSIKNADVFQQRLNEAKSAKKAFSDLRMEFDTRVQLIKMIMHKRSEIAYFCKNIEEKGLSDYGDIKTLKQRLAEFEPGLSPEILINLNSKQLEALFEFEGKKGREDGRLTILYNEFKEVFENLNKIRAQKVENEKPAEDKKGNKKKAPSKDEKPKNGFTLSSFSSGIFISSPKVPAALQGVSLADYETIVNFIKQDAKKFWADNLERSVRKIETLLSTAPAINLKTGKPYRNKQQIQQFFKDLNSEKKSFVDGWRIDDVLVKVYNGMKGVSLKPNIVEAQIKTSLIRAIDFLDNLMTKIKGMKFAKGDPDELVIKQFYELISDLQVRIINEYARFNMPGAMSSKKHEKVTSENNTNQRFHKNLERDIEQGIVVPGDKKTVHEVDVDLLLDKKSYLDDKDEMNAVTRQVRAPVYSKNNRKK